MKYLAFIISFYILSLAVTPGIKVLRAKFTSEHCKKMCTEGPLTENEDGCQKQNCTPFTCCFKTFIFSSYYNLPAQFLSELTVKNNYSLKRIFLSPPTFDIWHPPKFV